MAAGGLERAARGRLAAKGADAERQPALEEAPVAPASATCSRPWEVNGNNLMQAQVIGRASEPLLACTSCFMRCNQPRYAHRGLAKGCSGAGGRSNQGSRAQARSDFAKGVLPGKEKLPISDLVSPTPQTRERWARSLGACTSLVDGPLPSAAASPPRLAVAPEAVPPPRPRLRRAG